MRPSYKAKREHCLIRPGSKMKGECCPMKPGCRVESWLKGEHCPIKLGCRAEKKRYLMMPDYRAEKKYCLIRSTC